MSYGTEWAAAEGTRRRMGRFPCPFFLCSLVQTSVETEVQSRSDQLSAVQLFEKSWAAQRFVLSLGVKSTRVLQKQTLSASLRACKYWLSVRFWLVQSVYPKRCLCWTRKSSLPCGSSYLLIVVDGVLNFILMGNNIKTDQLVRRQKCVQPLQIKPFQWEKVKLWFPGFQFDHPKSTRWFGKKENT